MESLRGVYAILATPFLPDGELDEASLRNLTAATIEAGVDGITVLGVAGEAHKLDDTERLRVLTAVLEVNNGRLPVVVGTSRESTFAAIAAARSAEAEGASAIMVAPPTFVQPGPGLTKHFQEIGAAVTTPIVLQDYPPINGVTLDIADMVTLVHAVPQIYGIKVEDPPTPHRISQLVAQLGDDISIVGGLGGVYLLDELRCGSHGTMTGFAYPEVLATIWQAWADGDHGGAAVVYHKYLPLLQTEGQPKLGLALRKEILRRRGWIAYATVRNPGPKADAQALAVLSQTLADVGIDRAVLGGSVSAAG